MIGYQKALLVSEELRWAFVETFGRVRGNDVPSLEAGGAEADPGASWGGRTLG
jgi:hypothetical protein